MANRVVPGYTQVPVAQKDLVEFNILRLDPAGTVFQATIRYEVRDSDGALVKTKVFSKQGPGVLAAPAIAQLLSEINAVEGT